MEAKHPIPNLMSWDRYPHEQEVDRWSGRKQPFRWFRHYLAPADHSHADNSHHYMIRYHEPKLNDIVNRRGQFLGTEKSGHDYSVTHNRPEPYGYADPETKRHPIHFKELGRYKTPADAWRAVRAHYDETHGIERSKPTPKPNKAPQVWDQLPRNKETAVDTYFELGHGDDDEPYLVWAQVGGKILKSKPIAPTDKSQSHGSLWGHDITNRDFKGRFEPKTGRLSIVKPRQMAFRDLPSDLLRKLYRTFPNITDIREF